MKRKFVQEVTAHNYMEAMHSVLTDRARNKIKFIIIGKFVVSWGGEQIANPFCPNAKQCAGCGSK